MRWYLIGPIFLFISASALFWNQHHFFHIPKSKSTTLKYLGGSSMTKGLRQNQIYQSISWNVYKGNYKVWHDQAPDFFKDFDFMLLQEAKYHFGEGTPSMHRTLDALTHHRNLAVSWKFKLAQYATGVLTCSKIAPAKTEFIRTKGLEGLILPKITQFSWIPILDSNQHLLLANVHALNFHTAATFQFELTRIHRVLKRHKGPIIFAGDFNTNSKEKEKILKQMAQDVGLKMIPYQGPTATVINFGPIRWEYRLDYVFYRGITIKEFSKLDQMRKNRWSDHSALVFSFSLKDQTN